MKQSRGFIGLPALLAIIVVLLAAGGGTAWYLEHRPSAPPNPELLQAIQEQSRQQQASSTQEAISQAELDAGYYTCDRCAKKTGTPDTWQSDYGAGQTIWYNPAGNAIGYPNGKVSVPGMSKYTDSDFGFSFWYPSGWQVSVVADGNADKTVLEELAITDPSLPDEVQLYVHFMQSPPDSIRYGNKAYNFDVQAKTWADLAGGSPKDMDQRITMGGLSLLSGTQVFNSQAFVRLDSTHILVVSSGNLGMNGYEYLLAMTMGTTTSAALASAIEAEKQAYIRQ